MCRHQHCVLVKEQLLPLPFAYHPKEGALKVSFLPQEIIGLDQDPVHRHSKARTSDGEQPRKGPLPPPQACRKKRL